MSRAFEQPLYHGTIARISHIDVTFGRSKKDFGRGFYMALDLHQAVGMMHKKYREAIRRSKGEHGFDIDRMLYRIQLDPNSESALSVKLFSAANMEWLDFILANRSASTTAHAYDVVVGPTADDDTIISLQNYWKGVYGRVGTEVARQALLSALEVDNLGVQCCLCTQKAADACVESFELLDWRTVE